MKVELLNGHNHLDDIKTLFAEHLEALGFDIKGPELAEEFADLPYKYKGAKERLYIAYVNGTAAGCIAMRYRNEEQAGVKRIYVRFPFRRMNLGQTLVKQVIEDAKELGYKQLVVDTLPPTETAREFYHFMGFKPNDNLPKSTIDGALFLYLDL